MSQDDRKKKHILSLFEKFLTLKKMFISAQWSFLSRLPWKSSVKSPKFYAVNSDGMPHLTRSKSWKVSWSKVSQIGELLGPRAPRGCDRSSGRPDSADYVGIRAFLFLF